MWAPPQPVRTEHRQRRGWAFAGVVVAVVGVLAAVGIANRDDNDTTPRYTPTEAACVMMRDGDSPDDAYRAMQQLVSDSVARRAVDAAVAQGC